jgi:two-component system chemotaxis response regulator CheB
MRHSAAPANIVRIRLIRVSKCSTVSRVAGIGAAIGVGTHFRYHIVAVAASAGGLAAITEVLHALPADFPLPIVIVQHLDPHHRSHMAEILASRTRLRVCEAAGREDLQPGVVYIAPPDFHAEVVNGSLVLTHSAPVHFVRPSADRLFLSAARRGQTIAVVLSGTGLDGAEGAAAVKAAGGVVIAQDEKSSAHFGMARAAIENGAVDYVLSLEEIGPALLRLARTAE